MCSFALFLLKYTEAGFLLPVEEKRKEFCRERIAYYLSASSCQQARGRGRGCRIISGCLSAGPVDKSCKSQLVTVGTKQWIRFQKQEHEK